jgi:hypothetical protein
LRIKNFQQVLLSRDKLDIQISRAYPNSISNCAIQEYDARDGKGCNKIGIYNLIIVHIYTKNYFCNLKIIGLGKWVIVINHRLYADQIAGYIRIIYQLFSKGWGFLYKQEIINKIVDDVASEIGLSKEQLRMMLLKEDV